jgi:hypothetical protein
MRLTTFVSKLVVLIKVQVVLIPEPLLGFILIFSSNSTSFSIFLIFQTVIFALGNISRPSVRSLACLLLCASTIRFSGTPDNAGETIILSAVSPATVRLNIS